MFDSYLISLGIGSPASIGYLITFGLKPAAVVTSVPGCATLTDTIIGAATLSVSLVGSATITEQQCTL